MKQKQFNLKVSEAKPKCIAGWVDINPEYTKDIECIKAYINKDFKQLINNIMGTEKTATKPTKAQHNKISRLFKTSTNFTTQFDIQLSGIGKEAFVNYTKYHGIDVSFDQSRGIVMFYKSDKVLTGSDIEAMQ